MHQSLCSIAALVACVLWGVHGRRVQISELGRASELANPAGAHSLLTALGASLLQLEAAAAFDLSARACLPMGGNDPRLLTSQKFLRRSSLVCMQDGEPLTVEGWFEDRFGCTKAEVEKALEDSILPKSVRSMLETDWPRADAASEEVQQLLSLSREGLRNLLLKFPAVLAGTIPKLVEQNFAPLREFLQLDAAAQQELVVRHPKVFAYKFQDVKPRLENVKSLLSLGDAELRTVVLTYPAVLHYDETEFAEKLLPELQSLYNPKSFQKINLEYPGLEILHRNPDIFAVKDFLTNDECERLMAKARPTLAPGVTYFQNADGKVEAKVDESKRKCTLVNVKSDEIPTIVSKFVALSNCESSQLEIPSVVRYKEGGFFAQHSDGFDGPMSSGGFKDSGRMVVVFCYLNDVDEGGETRFPFTGIDVKPQKGTAVVHFPATRDFVRDTRVVHEGAPAKDEKWLLATLIWKDPEVDRGRIEAALPTLSDDII